MLPLNAKSLGSLMINLTSLPVKDHTATNWWKKYKDSELVAFRGSIVHGTYRPNSHPNSIDDIDIMGLFVAPLEHYLGHKQKETDDFFEGEWDVVMHELRKAIFLLGGNNPNVLNLLWLRKGDYLHVSELGQLLIDNRDIFMSKQIHNTFTGYAHDQMKKMTNAATNGYMGAKRKQLVTQFGYDTKNASHMIRLLNTAKETLADGKLRVYRPDFQLYLDIKDGKYTLDQVKEMAEQLFEETHAAYVKSPLPEKSPLDKVEKLCVDILKEKFKISNGK